MTTTQTEPFETCPDNCPSCSARIVKRYTAGGVEFYGCTAYPACRWVYRTEAKPVTTHQTREQIKAAANGQTLPFLRGPVGQ